MPLVIRPEMRRHIAIAKDIMQSPYFFINPYPFIFYTNLDDYTKINTICQALFAKKNSIPVFLIYLLTKAGYMCIIKV